MPGMREIFDDHDMRVVLLGPGWAGDWSAVPQAPPIPGLDACVSFRVVWRDLVAHWLWRTRATDRHLEWLITCSWEDCMSSDPESIDAVAADLEVTHHISPEMMAGYATRVCGVSMGTLSAAALGAEGVHRVVEAAHVGAAAALDAFRASASAARREWLIDNWPFSPEYGMYYRLVGGAFQYAAEPDSPVWLTQEQADAPVVESGGGEPDLTQLTWYLRFITDEGQSEEPYTPDQVRSAGIVDLFEDFGEWDDYGSFACDIADWLTIEPVTSHDGLEAAVVRVDLGDADLIRGVLESNGNVWSGLKPGQTVDCIFIDELPVFRGNGFPEVERLCRIIHPLLGSVPVTKVAEGHVDLPGGYNRSGFDTYVQTYLDPAWGTAAPPPGTAQTSGGPTGRTRLDTEDGSYKNWPIAVTFTFGCPGGGTEVVNLGKVNDALDYAEKLEEIGFSRLPEWLDQLPKSTEGGRSRRSRASAGLTAELTWRPTDSVPWKCEVTVEWDAVKAVNKQAKPLLTSDRRKKDKSTAKVEYLTYKSFAMLLVKDPARGAIEKLLGLAGVKQKIQKGEVRRTTRLGRAALKIEAPEGMSRSAVKKALEEMGTHKIIL